MKEQKVSTILGTIILIIIVATVAGFVLICFKNYPVKSDMVQLDNSKKQQSVNTISNQKTISIVKKGDMNYVIYTDENGSEIEIDKAPWNRKNWENENRNVTEYVPFIDARLSQTNEYIIYTADVYDIGEIARIYDIERKIKIKKIHGNILDFTPGEKYVFSCGQDVFIGYGNVYSVPDFKEIYSVHGKVIGEEQMEYYNNYRVDSCNFEERKNAIRFHLRNVLDNQDTKDVYFDLNAHNFSKQE